MGMIVEGVIVGDFQGLDVIVDTPLSIDQGMMTRTQLEARGSRMKICEGYGIYLGGDRLMLRYEDIQRIEIVLRAV